MSTEISQEVQLAGADDASAEIPQAVPLVGADGAETDVSLFAVGVGADSAETEISQFVLLVGRGPEVVPPEDNPVGTFTVGAGLGLDWFLALQLSDSGIELRDKVVKDPRATGKFTSGKLKVYGYGPKEDIDVEDIEDGTGQKAMVLLDDSTQVQQSKLLRLNVKNAMMHTVRIEGIWDGVGIPDRVDELVYQVARQGVRR